MTVQMRLATEDDLAFLTALEARLDYTAFITQWPVERHRARLSDPNFAYRIFEEQGEPIGFGILTGLTSPHRAIELSRVALQRAGEGRGRACCELLMAEAFDRYGAHRFYLDWFDTNVRAGRLYASLGFRDEGLLRDAQFKDGVFRSLRVMSILEDEYRALSLER